MNGSFPVNVSTCVISKCVYSYETDTEPTLRNIKEVYGHDEGNFLVLNVQKKAFNHVFLNVYKLDNVALVFSYPILP